MTYTIMFLEQERVTRMTSWDTGLEAAKRYACLQLVDRFGERAEVWDGADRLVFQFSLKPEDVIAERNDLIERPLPVR